MTGIAPCCARAASGHAAAAPPSNEMNSRRFIALTQTQGSWQYSRSGPCIAAKADTQCPLWVKSGKAQDEQMLSGVPRKRTKSTSRFVRFVPKADITRCSKLAPVSAAFCSLWLALGASGQPHREHRAFAWLARHSRVTA